MNGKLTIEQTFLELLIMNFNKLDSPISGNWNTRHSHCLFESLKEIIVKVMLVKCHLKSHMTYQFPFFD